MRRLLAWLPLLGIALAPHDAAAATVEITYQLSGGTFHVDSIPSQTVVGGTARLRFEAAGLSTFTSGPATLVSLSVIGPTNRMRLVNPHAGALFTWAFLFGGALNVFQFGPALSQSTPVAFSDSYIYGALSGAPQFVLSDAPSYYVGGNFFGTEVSRVLVDEPSRALAACAAFATVGLGLFTARRRAQPAR